MSDLIYHCVNGDCFAEYRVELGEEAGDDILCPYCGWFMSAEYD
jgi:DNA-directed RNA polymerase subunit RPC12/RpoP